MKKHGNIIPVVLGLALLGMLTGFLLPDGGMAASRMAGMEKQADTAAASSPDTSRIITDMLGRRVTIPSKITKVLSTSPPPTTFIYMLAPEKLGGWMGKISDTAKKFIPPQYRDIPVVGWERSGANYEAYIAARPDMVFVGFEAGSTLSQVELAQEKFGDIPVVCVKSTRDALDYGDTLTFIGDVLGVSDRARALNTYYQTVLKEVQGKVSTIPETDRVRVYYAEGDNGLSTDPKGSPHSQLIEVCGGVNVADCSVSSGSGMTQVGMESVLMWQPVVIITTSREFAAKAPGDETWQKIPAVRQQKIYVTPSAPFNWFDRPPGVNRIVGIPWTAHLLYPGLFPEAWFLTKAKEFYSIFYHYDLSDAELAELQQNGGLR